MRALRALVILLGLALVVAQCDAGFSTERTETAETAPQASTEDEPIEVNATTTTVAVTTTTAPEPCRVRDPGPVSGDPDPARVALKFSQRGFTCSEHVTVSVGDPDALQVAARAAVDRGGPLLIQSPTLSANELATEITRLGVESMTLVGPVSLPDDLKPASLSRPGVGSDVEPIGGLDRDSPEVWLIAGTDAMSVLPAAVMGHALGVTVQIAADRDLRTMSAGEADSIRMATNLRTIGVDDANKQWELAVARRGLLVPGGGQTLFPGKRLVASYGTPGSGALGVLGETGPERSLERLLEFADGYEADGSTVVPAFNIISTVASAGPTDDGDYSEEVPLETIRPWVEFAAKNDVYVVLDLQPGRTDFLTQAQRLEEFLLLPNVGLALDPEWRLEPDQVHLRQIGSVEAAEVNRVADWLADLTRQHLLPQKLLLVHQFKLSMIQNRPELRSPPELALVIQMDGQGPLGTKYDTFDALVQGTEGAPWRWGWKNFFDEDSPMGTADQVLSVEPTPVFISFQ